MLLIFFCEFNRPGQGELLNSLQAARKELNERVA